MKFKMQYHLQPKGKDATLTSLGKRSGHHKHEGCNSKMPLTN